MIGTANGCWFGIHRPPDSSWVFYEFFVHDILCLKGFCKDDELEIRFYLFNSRMSRLHLDRQYRSA